MQFLKYIPVLLFLLLPEVMEAQRYWYFQDTTRYHPVVAELERMLFPYNDRSSSRVAYYGCVHEQDSLILYMRRHRPDTEEVIERLRQIMFNRETDDTTGLNYLYIKHIEYFKKEWECALRQPREARCPEFERQLLILFAFENCILSIKLRYEYPDPADYFNFLLTLHRGSLILHYRKIYMENPEYSHIQHFDERSFEMLREVTDEYIEHIRSLQRKTIHNPYFKDKIAILGRAGTWGFTVYKVKPPLWRFFTPDLEAMLPYIREYYQNKPEDVRLESYVYTSFFGSKVRLNDLKRLGLIE